MSRKGWSEGPCCPNHKILRSVEKPQAGYAEGAKAGSPFRLNRRSDLAQWQALEVVP